MLIQLTCPACHRALTPGANNYHCLSCQHTYSCTLGIPSLGKGDLASSDAEQALIERLLAMYATATVDDMSRARLAIGATNEERRQYYAQYHRTLRERGAAFHRMFQLRVRQQAWPPHGTQLALDIGCGVGSGLLMLAREFDYVVGVDISLSSLIIARKVLEEANVQNVTLVHASAHHLPFVAGTVDYAMSINVLEHIFTPETILAEVQRVLRMNGVFAGDSRNRFDLFFKEPHVGVRWVGYWPRRWMARYVRWRVGVDYGATHTHLLSYGELARALTTTFGTQWRIVLPDAIAYGANAKLGSIAEGIDRVGVFHPLLMRIAPSHIALAQRVQARV
jgi:SAM-dependent methyltransferase